MTNPILVYEASDGSFHKTESELRKHEFKIKVLELYQEKITKKYGVLGTRAYLEDRPGITWFIDTFWVDKKK